MKNKICHRTMGSDKRSNCIEEACTAWGIIRTPRLDACKMPYGKIEYGCRDLERKQP